MVVFEADIFVGQSEDEVEVRCEVSRKVKSAVSRYSGPSGLRFMVCPARRRLISPLGRKDMVSLAREDTDPAFDFFER